MAGDRYREVYEAFRWNVPAQFNITAACCTRWAGDGARIALRWEDEDGETRTLSYADLQQAANRLSNALASLGVRRGDRVAFVLPQRPETVVVYLACFQMDAIAVPLSYLFGPDALEYRLADSGAKVALVDPDTLQRLLPLRERLGELRHVIGVAGAREANVLDFDALCARASIQFEPAATAAHDPAAIIYTSGTTGPPKGALLPQCVLLETFPASSIRTTAFRKRATFSGHRRIGRGRAACGML